VREHVRSLDTVRFSPIFDFLFATMTPFIPLFLLRVTGPNCALC
jgi:hypothetical protein